MLTAYVIYFIKNIKYFTNPSFLALLSLLFKTGTTLRITKKNRRTTDE